MNRLAVYSKDLILDAGIMVYMRSDGDSYSYSIINHMHVYREGIVNRTSNTYDIEWYLAKL